MFKEISALIQKDLKIEWRNKYSLNGVFLYVFSTIFICYLAFEVKTGSIQSDTWNAVFWIIIVFAAVNSLIKSFTQEGVSRFYYYYQTCSPTSIIISKIIFNIVLMLIISSLSYIFYSIVLGNPIMNQGLFVINLVLGSLSFATALSLISGIASKTNNPNTLMLVLGFPVVVPILLILVRLSDYALSGIQNDEIIHSIWQLIAINLILGTLSYLLFPYLWRS